MRVVTEMPDFGAVVLASVLIACGIVAMWRQILAACAIVCLAIMFVGLFDIVSEVHRLFPHH